jgi:hypothetical protein
MNPDALSVTEEIISTDALSLITLAARGERDDATERSVFTFLKTPNAIEDYRNGCAINSRNPEANVRFLLAAVEVYCAAHGIANPSEVAR